MPSCIIIQLTSCLVVRMGLFLVNPVNLVSKDGPDIVLCGLLQIDRPGRLLTGVRAQGYSGPMRVRTVGFEPGQDQTKKTASLKKDARRRTDRLHGLRPGRPQLSKGECDDTYTLQTSRPVSLTCLFLYIC